MADKVVAIPGVGNVAFPDTMSDRDIELAAAGLSQQASDGAPTGSMLGRVTRAIPAIGGLVGGLAGGIPGAALGGAAGEGYRQLVQHAGDLPGAVRDIARNVVSQPQATLRGFLEGAGTGTVAATTQAGIQGGAQAVGILAGKGMTAGAGRLMQSALKPGLKMLLRGIKAGDPIQPVVKTLLDEGINVSAGGVAKLNRLLSATNDEISDAVAGATGSVAPVRVASRLSETARGFANQVNPEADLAAVSQAGEEFLSHPSVVGATMSVPQAQAMKVGTYRQLAGKYGELKSASVEAQKALARGLKEEIAKEVPSLEALNAREGGLIEALQAVSRRAGLQGNRDPVGFAWVTSHPMTFLAALFDRWPAVKSLVARGLYAAAGTTAQVSPQLIRTAVLAIAGGEEPTRRERR